MKTTALAHVEIPAPTAFELPALPPANDTDEYFTNDPVADWLALREIKARVLERVELLEGRYHHTAEVRLGAPDDERPVYVLAVTLALRIDQGSRDDLRELVRAWCRARGVMRRGWRPGIQCAAAKARAVRALRERGVA